MVRILWLFLAVGGLGMLGSPIMIGGATDQAIADEPWQADPSLVAKLSSNQKEFIYDERLVPEFTLPDPLKASDGELVTDAAQWPALREQTLELFRKHVYGRRPTQDYRVTFKTITERDGLFGVDAIGRSMVVEIKAGSEIHSFPMYVFMPTQATRGDVKSTGPFPAVVHINNRDFPSFEDVINVSDEFWPVQELVKRGFVACGISTVTIDPDRADGFDQGIRGMFHRAAGTKGSGDANADADGEAWRALSAWGWGASRALDYLVTQPSVDASKIAVIGHSRGGKAALWAAAEDPRFAIVCSNNSGCGGAALSRRAYGETVARITKAFPHWFCKNFSSYAGQEASLPVDQHQLIGLIAPRPVYVTSAADDLWADPRGEYLSLVEASPVYGLIGHEGMKDRNVPALEQPRTEGPMGYHIRRGAHGLTAYDWREFLNFCDKQWFNLQEVHP